MAHYKDQVPGTHDLADKKIVFNGWAAWEPHGEVKKWSYNPTPLGEDRVEIKITHSGICGSDIHTIDSGWFPTEYPVIPGHEIVGVITAVGSQVTTLKVGDRVGVGAQAGACMNKKGNCVECATDLEQHCRGGPTYTYNSKYPDGQHSFGGYADRVRVPFPFAFKIPDAIPSDKAAPLLCAGATVYSPLARFNVGKLGKVGIIGVGGLGHLALKYAVAMGANTVAVSHSDAKRADVAKWGVKHYLNSHDANAMKEAYRTFDFLLLTANPDGNIGHYLDLMKVDGTFCIVGAPEEDFKIPPFRIIVGRPCITASAIGSIKEIQEMLAFSAKHNVVPDIQTWPMEKVNDAIKTVRDGSIRYRAVLINP